jgi:hypothetical protein
MLEETPAFIFMVEECYYSENGSIRFPQKWQPDITVGYHILEDITPNNHRHDNPKFSLVLTSD